MTVRRFQVIGELPEGWRTTYRERLEEFAFRESSKRGAIEELEGWVSVHNLLDTDFSDYNTWLYDTYAVFSLRTDKKSLPGKLLKATVEKRAKEWAKERGLERVPASVKKQIKEDLTEEWMQRTFPRVATTDVVWKVSEGWLLIDTLSDGVADRLRKRFHRTFGLELHPMSPLDLVADKVTREDLLATSPLVSGGDA